MATEYDAHQARNVEESGSLAKYDEIGAQYINLLEQSAPHVLLVLGAICVFERGADIEVVGDLVARECLAQGAWFDAETSVSIPIGLLVDLGLVRVQATVEGNEVQGHPLVRGAYAKRNAVRLLALREFAIEIMERAYIPTPHGGYPSDAFRLDCLEEMVRQELALDRFQAAWIIYEKRIGGYDNLGVRLSEFARGERICRMLYRLVRRRDTGARELAGIICESWAQYLIGLGRLADAEACCDLSSARKSPKLSYVRGQIFCLRGELRRAFDACSEAIRSNNEQSGEDDLDSFALRGHILVLRGFPVQALHDFEVCLAWEKRHSDFSRPLYRWLGSYHIHLLALLGEIPLARRQASKMKRLLEARWGPDNFECCVCNLLLADLEEDYNAKISLLSHVGRCAVKRGVHIILLATLAQAREAIRRATSLLGENRCSEMTQVLREISLPIERGLETARASGFSIVYVDLLVARARALLLRGEVLAAESDARAALVGSLRAIESVGMPKIFAAADSACGYKWGEIGARYVIAESLLLRAAKILGRQTIPLEAYEGLDASIGGLLTRGRRQLEVCLRLLGDLSGPLVDKVKQTMHDLKDGNLTRFPLVSRGDVNRDGGSQSGFQVLSARQFDVFFSYNNEDQVAVEVVAQSMKLRDLKIWFAPWSFVGGDLWVDSLQKAITMSKSAAVFIGPSGLGRWQHLEYSACLKENRTAGLKIIPVLLPGAVGMSQWPDFLTQFQHINLQAGLSPEFLEPLEAAIKLSSAESIG